VSNIVAVFLRRFFGFEVLTLITEPSKGAVKPISTPRLFSASEVTTVWRYRNSIIIIIIIIISVKLTDTFTTFTIA